MKSENTSVREMKVKSVMASKAKTPIEAIRRAHFQQKILFLKNWWNKIPQEEKQTLLIYTWENSMFPFITGGKDWMPLFKEVGYFTTCNVAKPVNEVTLYRGCEPAYKGGMSWTPSVITALFFRERLNRYNKKKVYKVTLDPAAILAVTSDSGTFPFQHDFIEYIVDPAYIISEDIEEYDSAQLQLISEVVRRRGDGMLSEKQANRLIQIGIDTELYNNGK